jgi:uncharacterized membrane protein YgaE (UPF0421/DUF939 family)
MIPIPRPVWIYALKCVLAAAICFSLSRLLNSADFIWILISVMLVLSPDGKEALPLALTRIKANAIGASASLIFLFLGLPQAVGVCAAVAVAVLLCHLFKAMAGSRSALAAVIILMLREPGAHVWDAALGRLCSVAAGCAAGLLITLAFHRALDVVEGGEA